MKKITILIIIIIAILSFTNPTSEDFNRKIHEISYTGNNTYEEMKIFGIDKIYSSGYKRENYIIFSIYTTNGKTNKLWTKEGYKDKNITYIGIMKNFIKIKEEK